MNLQKIQLIFALAFLFQAVSFGQNWTSHESEQQINDLLETSTELLMATDAGLVVMDKATLNKSIFNTNNSSLTNNHIQTITESPTGDIWIGTYDVSIAKFNGTDFVDIFTPVNPGINQNTNLYDIEFASNGDLWLGTSDGVLQRQGTAWSFYDENDMDVDFFEAWDIEIDAAGDVYVGSIGMYKFSGGVWTNIFAGSSLQGYLDSEMFFANDGILYFAGDLNRLAYYDGTTWTEDSLGVTINNFGAGVFTEDLNGNIYFDSHYSGIFKLGNTGWDLQSNALITAVGDRSTFFHIDEHGNQWLNNNIHLFVDKSGIISNTLISEGTIEWDGITALHKGDNGKMYYIVNSNYNIAVKDTDGNWSSLAKPTISGINFENFQDILALADDNIWLSSSYGLYNYDGTTWIAYPLDVCRNFVRDSQGKIYVRATNNIYTIENNVIDSINSSNSGMTNFVLLGHGIDADDNLWIAAGENGGFAIDNLMQKRNSDGTWTTYLETDHPVLVRPIGNIVSDKEGNIWVSDSQYGAIKFDGTTFTNPVKDNVAQITNADVYSVKVDVEGSVYFSHQYGVTKLKEGNWENLVIANVPNQSSSHSSKIELDNEGTLWWASNRYGVFSYKQELVDATTFIFENAEVLNNFSVFPNPVKNVVNISFEIENEANVNAFLYNNMGQVVSSFNLGNISKGKHQQAMNVDGFAKGIYMLQLQIDTKTAIITIVVR